MCVSRLVCLRRMVDQKRVRCKREMSTNTEKLKIKVFLFSRIFANLFFEIPQRKRERKGERESRGKERRGEKGGWLFAAFLFVRKKYCFPSLFPPSLFSFSFSFSFSFTYYCLSFNILQEKGKQKYFFKKKIRSSRNGTELHG